MGGFKDFLFRGNLIQLSVAVVIGASFSDLIQAFTSGFITPLLGIFGGQPSFASHHFTINKSQFNYGNVIDAFLRFFITAIVLYYLVIYPSTWIIGKFKLIEEELRLIEDSNQKLCLHCYSKVNKKATRCPFCTSSIELEEVESEVIILDEENENENKVETKLLNLLKAEV